MTTIALDTDVAVALVGDSGPAAVALRRALAAGMEREDRFVLPLTVLGELWRVATEPPPGNAISPVVVGRFLELWTSRSRILLPGDRFLALVSDLVREREPRGAAIFDLLMLAICLEYGVNEIWTLDRKFPTHPAVRVLDPLR